MEGSPLTPVILWAIAGLVLILAEVATTTFVLVFFGVSALIVAALKLFGLDNLPVEILVFAIAALSGILLFRKKIRANFQSRRELTIDTDKIIILSDGVPPKGRAKISYQGALWTAVNETERPFQAGEKAVIVRTEGIELHIAPPAQP